MSRQQGTDVLTNTGELRPQALGEVRSVVKQIVSVQESMQAVLAGLTKLASGTEEQVREIASRVEDLKRVQRELVAAHHQAEEKMDALIAVVDDLVRRKKSGC
jgi:septation ring formation regulator EzrA